MPQEGISLPVQSGAKAIQVDRGSLILSASLTHPQDAQGRGPQGLWGRPPESVRKATEKDPRICGMGGEGQQRRTPSSVGIVTGKDSRVCGEGNKDLRIYGVYREGDRKGPQDLWGR